ncbi:glucosaminidase domain-containing protein [Shewanella sp. SNU WT4]|uniref:glucosaminidase domain-containing protein n=1 Tax=Shewanella sp. SNU WT4 TaxID=2590015 RepID=UPI00143D5C32|nr:glucosaminidase domain-containing protein [Shewanella sp. SNU WT4]
MKSKILMFLVWLMSARAYADDALPLPPELLAMPVTDAKMLAGGAAMNEYFTQLNYQLPLASSNLVPPILTKNLPENARGLSTSKADVGFIQLILPSVIAVNDQLLLVRQALVDLQQRAGDYTPDEQAWLQKLAQHYGLQQVDIKQLLNHVNSLPIGMVLAQAIDESGWGRSRFARQGDAIFGEHLPRGWPHYISTDHGRIKLAAYNTVYQGVAAYMYNINTQVSYAELRRLRAEYSARGGATGYQLVDGLQHYSIRGWHYVNDLKALIRHHHLDSYNKAKLSSHQWQWIEFSR